MPDAVDDILDRILVDPGAARRAAAGLVAAAQDAGDRETEARAERALGLAARELTELDAAEAHLRRSAAVARAARLVEREGEARMSLSLVLAMRGRVRSAMNELARAEAVCTGAAADRVVAQRAAVLHSAGRSHEALAGYSEALARFRASGAEADVVRVLLNRAIVQGVLGRLDAAEADLMEAAAISARTGLERARIDALEQLGQIAGRRGDVPAALAWHAEADRWHEASDEPDPVRHVVRCELALSIPLVDEARAHAEAAVAAFERHGHTLYLDQSRLLLAEAALLADDLDAARHHAGEVARSSAGRAGRAERARAGLARFLVLRAAWEGGGHSAATLATARRTIAALEAGGWKLPTIEARILAGRIALRLGRPDDARTELQGALASMRGAPAGLRARRWHAEALLRLAEGDRAGARRAVRAGLKVVERYQATMGATELRANAAWHAADLAGLGARVAAADGRPAELLAWAERGRAGALRHRPVRPPDDTELALGLAEVRRMVADLDAAANAGEDTLSLRQALIRAEDAVRRRARVVADSGRPAMAGGAAATATATATVVREALGPDRALVELVDIGGELWAVCVSGGRTHATALGPAAEASARLDALRFALRRVVHRRGSAAALATAEETVRSSAAALDAFLLGPVARWVGGRELVLSPTGGLHSAPWGLLPRLAERPVSVTPSASLWLRAAARDRDQGGGTVLVAGPGLDHAGAEIEALHASAPGAVVLTGAAAAAGATAAALDGSELAHLACHGRFRADHPLFSSLLMADGPLTVYDLEGLADAPRVVVLSACESGLSDVRPGDELMGLSASLFALGTSTLVASVSPVPDDATVRLMLDFHARLAKGARPAAALAAAQTELVDAAFVCFGAG